MSKANSNIMETINIILHFNNPESAMDELDNLIKEYDLARILHVSHSLTYSVENNQSFGNWTLTALIILR